MPKFKVGDRVYVRPSANRFMPYGYGTVVYYTEGHIHIKLLFDNFPHFGGWLTLASKVKLVVGGKYVIKRRERMKERR